MSDLWTDPSMILEDLEKLNHFGPGPRRRTRKPNLKLLDGHPQPPKKEDFEFPLGFEAVYNESEERIEPDHELITHSIRKVFNPYGYSNEFIEEIVRKKHCASTQSPSTSQSGDFSTPHKSPKHVSVNDSPKFEGKHTLVNDSPKYGGRNSSGDFNRKPNTYLNPESKEFKPSSSKIIIDDVKNHPVQSYLGESNPNVGLPTNFLNPLVPEFIPPNIEIQESPQEYVSPVQKKVGTTVKEVSSKLRKNESLETNDRRTSPVKNKKRVNIAIQSIMQIIKESSDTKKQDNTVDSQNNYNTMDKNIVKPSINKEKDSSSRFSLSSISDNEEVTEANTSTSNKIKVSDMESDDELIPVNNKCLSWLSTNQAIISGEVKRNNINLIKPTAPLNLDDDAFAFKPKNEKVESKCQSNTVSQSKYDKTKSEFQRKYMSTSLTPEEMYQLLCKQRELKNQKLEQSSNIDHSTPSKTSTSSKRNTSTTDSNWRNVDEELCSVNSETPSKTRSSLATKSSSDTNWRNADQVLSVTNKDTSTNWRNVEEVQSVSTTDTSSKPRDNVHETSRAIKKELPTYSNYLSWRNSVDEAQHNTTKEIVANNLTDGSYRSTDLHSTIMDKDGDNEEHVEATYEEENSLTSLESLIDDFCLIDNEKDASTEVTAENDADGCMSVDQVPDTDDYTCRSMDITPVMDDNNCTSLDEPQSTSQGSDYSTKNSEKHQPSSCATIIHSTPVIKYTSEFVMLPTVYPQTPSDMQSTASSSAASPPLCKEQPQKKTPMNLNTDDIYQKLFKMKEEQQKNKICHVGEFEKNTIWEAIAPKLKKKKK